MMNLKAYDQMPGKVYHLPLPLLLLLHHHQNFYFKVSKMWQLKEDGVGGTAIFRPQVFLCVLLLFMSSKTCSSIGDDALAAGQNLTGTNTLISEGGNFELGFFSKGKDDSLKFYLGIWYKNFADQTIVWVANRDKPLTHSSSAVLELSEDGNLAVLDDSSNSRVWTTNLLPQASNSTEAVLLRDGNFVLRNSSEPSVVYWQSFDHPTDTWLAGATLGTNKLSGETTRLTSWKNSEDPAPGMFSLEVDPNGSAQLFIEWNMSRRYWSSGLWNGQLFSSFPEIRLNYIYNYSFVSNEREHYFTYSISEKEALSRMVMERSGQLRQLTFVEGMRDWNLFWTQPTKQSDVFALCGPFGIFNEQNPPNPCSCLQGFESLSKTQLNDTSSGCVRKTPLQCESKSSNRKYDGFLSISNVKFPANSKIYPATNGTVCESACMQNCLCTAYAYHRSRCSIWEGALLNLQSSYENNTKQDIHIKLAASELHDAGGNRNKLWVIAIVVPLAMVVSSFFIWHLCRRKFSKNGTRHPSEDLYLFEFDGNSIATDCKTKTRYNLMSGKKRIDLPFFSFMSVSTATGGFSSTNKLGEGGFGPVYRGELLNGQEIAVKRLSKRSGQGLEEFRNETILISKLQHRNLVKLLGYCIERDENILIYEYMPNKSLDFFLFDSSKRGLLDWKTRRHIIEGIAQGLLYLHQYSRLRIIHRDLKASNILLDAEMNPKISDFGMARMFRGNELQANTKRVVGTYGYMAPEYAMEGHFSIKSDIFSFGVLLLEMLSGRRNSGFYHTNYLNLIVYAWDLWTADKGLDLVDPILDCPCSSLRYINIGLLCVQDNPANRPTTADVVTMLGDEVAPLPTPKQPAFCTSRAVDTNSSSPNRTETCSVNGVTISMIQGR